MSLIEKMYFPFHFKDVPYTGSNESFAYDKLIYDLIIGQNTNPCPPYVSYLDVSIRIQQLRKYDFAIQLREKERSVATQRSNIPPEPGGKNIKRKCRESPSSTRKLSSDDSAKKSRNASVKKSGTTVRPHARAANISNSKKSSNPGGDVSNDMGTSPPTAASFYTQGRSITSLEFLVSKIRKPFILDLWTPLEIAKFEGAICCYGKQFHEVSQVVGTKNYKECIDFYYQLWKMTNRYRAWKDHRTQSECICEDMYEGSCD